jgi:hypothetical protein
MTFQNRFSYDDGDSKGVTVTVDCGPNKASLKEL